MLIHILEVLCAFAAWMVIGMTIAAITVAHWQAFIVGDGFHFRRALRWIYRKDMTFGFILALFWPLSLLLGLIIRDERVRELK